MRENETLVSLFHGLQEKKIAELKSVNALHHNTDKGDLSEECWIKWFGDYLPKRYKAAKATVIDCKGNYSDQIDLVLYDAQYSYLALQRKNILYIPAESVYAVFEIKPDITKRNMNYAGDKAASVRKLYRTSASIPYAGGVYDPKPLHRILAGILTTKSGWQAPFGDPFKQCIRNYDEIQQIDCGCVLEKGSFFYNYSTSILKTSQPDESLIYFFLQLLILLQNIGTVPAIDLAEYMRSFSITEEVCKEFHKE